MFLKFNKQKKTIFLDKNSNEFNISESVNIILSPSLYWVKKVSLPVKYVREVNPLLVSLFEETLPDGIYSYYAYKSGDAFYIFAYEDKMILDLLSEKKITSSQINHVYFAQSEISCIDKAIKIDDKDSLYLKDDILVLIPTIWLKDSLELDISSITFSKNSITLKQFSHLVDDKSLYTLIAIFLVLLTLVATEYFITLNKISTVLQSRDEIFSKNGLKSTMMQNRSMLKEYEHKHSRQTKLRVYIANLLKLPLPNATKLSLIDLKAKKLKIEFKGVDENSKYKIIKNLKAKKMRFKSTMKRDILHLEIEL